MLLLLLSRAWSRDVCFRAPSAARACSLSAEVFSDEASFYGALPSAPAITGLELINAADAPFTLRLAAVSAYTDNFSVVGSPGSAFLALADCAGSAALALALANATVGGDGAAPCLAVGALALANVAFAAEAPVLAPASLAADLGSCTPSRPSRPGCSR
jgi:hypothetical protein